MAVLRTQFLFAAQLPPSSKVALRPSKTGIPDDVADPRELTYQTVYTCPSGKRAIMRTLTGVLVNATPGYEPVYYVDHYTPQGPTRVHWFWFVNHLANVAQWQLSDTWNAQVVLNAGETLMVANLSVALLFVEGSGALVDV